jgi:type II secretory pathway component PulC
MSRTSLLLAFVAGTHLAAGCAAQKPRPDQINADEHLLSEETSRATEAPSAEARPAAPAAATKEAKHAIGTIKRAELVKVLDAAPGRFLQHVETEPRLVGGRFHGWRLASFFPGDERFAAVDLEPGDVILAVNGQSIEQPDQLMKVWDALRTGTALVVSLERDGQPRQLRFEIRE